MANDRADFWDSEPSSSTVNQEQFAAVKPKSKAAQAQEAREAREAEYQATVKAATNRRRQWDKAAVGRARTRDITDLYSDNYRAYLAKHGMSTESGNVEAGGKVGMTKGQIYGAMGVVFSGHAYGDQQLPGMENPDAAPEPPRWEELEPHERAKARRKLAAYGMSIESMSNDFGAQLDQAIMRAADHKNFSASTGAPVPFTQHFYDKHPHDTPNPPLDEPGEILDAASRQTGRPRGQVVAATALTSPNTFFSRGPVGARYSPNVETAVSAIEQHDQGVPSHEITLGRSPRGTSNQGYPANSQKVGRMLDHLDSGQPLNTFKNPPSKTNPLGSSPFGPKTGPFSNSSLPDTPDFFVSDVHSGGGGMAPHLGTAKRRDEQGKLGDSEREEAIKNTPYYHSAADYAARKALFARGHGSGSDSKDALLDGEPGEGRYFGQTVRQPQAGQWGEEQIQRGEAGGSGFPKVSEAYPVTGGHLSSQQFRPVDPNQGTLF